jgi:CubicO group peptidase (beta-lactamase class C family)
VTKPFTAVAVMILVEEGKVRLSDPVGQYVTRLPAAWKRVTVEQLMNHTGGIPLYPFSLNSKTERLEYTRDDILRMVSGKPLLFEPGERFEYSNLGYYLLGIVIEEAGGMPYAEFLDACVFKPLGMRATRINNYSIVLPNRARGHEWRGELRLGAYQSPSSYAPAGGILSSVVDLAKMESALSTPVILKPRTLERMMVPATVAGGATYPYGLGWNLDWVRGRRDFNHRGGNAGFSSTLHRYVDDGVTVIILANLAAANLERVARGVAGCVVPELRPLADMEVGVDPHPAWTEQLRSGLVKLSRGAAHPLFAPEFRDEFKRLNRTRALAARLESLKAFSFLESRNVERWRANRPGGVVHRLEYYRLVCGSRTQGYVFSVDADGRVLWIEVEEETPRPSEMAPDKDAAAVVSQHHQSLVLGWAAGRHDTSTMTDGLRQAFTEEALRSFQLRLAGATGLHFVASRDTRGDQVSRLGCEVVGVRYYRVMKPGQPLFLVCYLGPDGKLADVELSYQ